MHKYDGNCNCGAINFEINSNDIKTIVNCHCNLCRKINGAAFSTYVVVLDTGFKLLKGKEHLKFHLATAQASKNFCATCGTPIFNSNPKYKGVKIVHLGALNNVTNLIPRTNIFCESKLSWLDNISTIESFAQARN